MRRELDKELSGNEKHHTACSLLVMIKKSCSNLHSQKCILILFSKTSGGARRTPKIERDPHPPCLPASPIRLLAVRHDMGAKPTRKTTSQSTQHQIVNHGPDFRLSTGSPGPIFARNLTDLNHTPNFVNLGIYIQPD